MNNTAYPDVGQTIRQPSTAIFGIDSADRYTLGSDGVRVDTQGTYNFSLYKGQSVLNGFIKRLALTEINMEWNVPNVNTYNNKFGIGINGADVSDGFQNVIVEVPIGFYTPTELATELETLVNDYIDNNGLLDPGISADFTFTIDPKTLYITIVSTITGGAGVVSMSLPTRGNTDDTALELCTMYEMLGLSNLLLTSALRINTPSYKFTTKIQGNYASYLYTRYIDIVSENLTKKQEVKDSSTQPSELGSSNLLARLYVGNSGLSESRFDISGVGCNIVGTRPFQLYKEYNTPKYIYWDSREFINLIDIKINDDAGRPLFTTADIVIESEDVIGGFDVISGNTSEFQITMLASEN